MRVHGLTVGRNEAGRYLERALTNNVAALDTLTFFDDQSDDDTFDIAKGIATHTIRRTDDTPAFLEHEGRFRQDAYYQMCLHVDPAPGDWIISIDCDEFLCTTNGDDPRPVMLDAITRAGKVNAVQVPIPECFGYDTDGTPMVRTDGWWGKVIGTRLFRWLPGGEFADKPMGSGSEPTYATKPPFGSAGNLRIMHLGYADPTDVQKKYARYNAMAHGHNDKHIQSIIQRPTLERWSGTWRV